MATSGQGLGSTPYLNAQDITIYLPPAEPEFGEDRDYMAWIYEVQWL
jgi:hypothetical protein